MSDVRTVIDTYRWVVPCTVLRRKDADTLVVMAQVPGTIDIPMLSMHTDMVFPQELVLRLEGVDAPEKKTPEGKAAISFVDGWLLRHGTSPLYLATDNKKDSFGRTLGDLRLSPSYLTGLAWDLLQADYAEPYVRHGAW